MRRVFDFLELPWDEAVLSPAQRAHEKRFISTPSYSQVVQPINSQLGGPLEELSGAFCGELCRS